MERSAEVRKQISVKLKSIVKSGLESGAGKQSLVVGASGQVGRQIVHALAAEGGLSPLETSRRAVEGCIPLELSELADVQAAAGLLDEFALDSIFCVAGMTYVDGCEAAPELAYRTNATGPGVLAAYARSREIPFVYYSTEYVFDGAADHPGPYGEDEPTHPLSVYGMSKLEGERTVMEAHPGALVIRTTVVYGPDAQQKNFLYSLMRNLKAGQKMRVPEDQISTPTYNRDLVSATLGLVAHGATGIFHVCGPELLSRLEFARRAAGLLGLDAGLLEGVSTQNLGQPARRPLAAGLLSSKLNRLYPAYRMRTLTESLEDCASELHEFIDHDCL